MRGIETDYTWNYSSFAMGRLTEVQTYRRGPVDYTYYEPSGLIHTGERQHGGQSDRSTRGKASYHELLL